MSRCRALSEREGRRTPLDLINLAAATVPRFLLLRLSSFPASLVARGVPVGRRGNSISVQTSEIKKKATHTYTHALSRTPLWRRNRRE